MSTALQSRDLVYFPGFQIPFLKIFNYFWLCWFLVAAHGLPSIVVACVGLAILWRVGSYFPK